MIRRNSIGSKVLDRFICYTQIETTSDKNSSSVPSTSGQRQLAKILMKELQDLGVSDVTFDKNGFLIAKVPFKEQPAQGLPAIGFMAHLDTSPDVSGKNVNPQILEEYDGKIIKLQNGVQIDPEKQETLLQYRGETIITGDGTTLLGADDKAGIAEIMTAVEYMMREDHPPKIPVEIIFTPDEEIGTGMDHFPYNKTKALCFYTIDGGGEGTVEAECFNAYKSIVQFTGNVIHLGVARGELVNAVSMAAEFVRMLPRSESPEAADDGFGYYCPVEIKGDLASAQAEILLRDFSSEEMRRRIDSLEKIGKAVEALHPGGEVQINTVKQYLNMKNSMDKVPEIMSFLLEAIRTTGIEPELRRIRGGTDGARLAERGIPSPNFFTGGHNFHSVAEWIALPAMIRTVKVIGEIIRLWSGK